MEDSKEYKIWKQKRSAFRCISSIKVILSGAEDITTITMIFLLMDRHGLSRPDAAFYYSVTEMFFCLAHANGSLLLGRYADKTQKIRLLSMVNLFISCLCNLIYTLPLPLWIVLSARGLMGITRALNPTVLGEIRRVYNHDKKELTNVIIWFSINIQIGRNAAAIIILVLGHMSFKIGSWKIDHLVACNVIVTILAAILIVVSYFKLTDVSLELDQIKLHCSKKFDGQQNETKAASPKVLMKWTDLFNKDIISIILSFSLIRYTTLVLISNVSILAASAEYEWSSNSRFLVFLLPNILFLFIILAINYSRFLADRTVSFFIYVIALCLACIVLTGFLLTKTGLLETFMKQIIFFIVLKTIKNFSIYFGFVCSNFLLFILVKPEDSSFIAGARTYFSVLLKGIACFISYKSSFYPEYFYPPAIIVLLVLAQFLLYRRHLYLPKRVL
ncbi:uncharacterized protein [Clytia hemisphaerica]|uniref:uncharacterized protein n=1 Tax=Clytia hemisphaerica TaxID=252671 RepID=UPI0034D5FB2D